VLEDASIFPAALDHIMADVDALYGGPHRREDGVVYYPNRVQDAWRIRDSVRTLATAPKALGLLEELYGRGPLPFQTINFRKGTQQAAHSDAVHFSTIPPGFMAGVWVALEDMDMDNGPLVFYPGSHKLPEVTMEEIGVEANRDDYKHYEEWVGALLEREGLQPQYGTIKRGQAIVWAANLLHGGSPQADRERSRHSQVTHYFFEGCKYYTPILSEPDAIRWRDPEWIRAEA
jgi:ectoine hydroxylase-related dioxygenase (phytanoyl-CoA dioxygenase family)